jgi:hypothetical protein
MKKILLFTLAIGIAVSVSAQVVKPLAHYNGSTVKFAPVPKVDVPTNQSSIINSVQKNPNAAKTNNTVSIIPMGTAGNALGFAYNGRTYLWADDNIGAVAFTHRAGATPGSGYLQYDLSVDNGATWEVNIGPVYSPDGTTTFNARYPQSAIYNPSGNTNPDNAYVSYWAPTLEGTNSNWGGICYGVHKLDSSTAPTQAVFSTASPYFRYIPNGYHITQTGVAYALEESDSVGTTYIHNPYDNYIMDKGIWNSGTGSFDYTTSSVTIPLTSMPTDPTIKYGADYKIAFAPDGITGYIGIIGHDDYTFMPDSVYYPILYKTTNGGSTWTGPIRVDLTNMTPLHDAFFPGNDTMFLISSGFEFDLAVDGDGNPYMAMNACVAVGNWSVPSVTVGSDGTPYHLMTCIYSPDGGVNFDAIVIDNLETFRGTFGAGTATEISSDNRPQIATNMASDAMFVTWIDTDTTTFGSADGNFYPDLHMRGFYTTDHVVHPALTDPSNVTTGSSADGAAFMGSASYYVFDSGADQFEVPMMFQQMDPADMTIAVTYQYIKGAICDLSPIGIKETTGNIASVSQNYPNPFSGSSLVTVNLNAKSDLSLSVSNLLGQKVFESNKGTVAAGTYNFNIDGSSLTSGVYTYTVKAGDYQLTRKMIVE